MECSLPVYVKWWLIAFLRSALKQKGMWWLWLNEKHYFEIKSCHTHYCLCFPVTFHIYVLNFYFEHLQLFAIIVFGCISSEGWRYDRGRKRETCLFNDNGNVCNYGVGIGVIAFLASIGFLAGEYLFEQMSSVKTRKHYVLGDLGFSGKFFYLMKSIINSTFVMGNEELKNIIT